MKNRNSYGNLMGYVDICMNLVVGFIVLFMFALMLVRIEDNSKPKAVVDTNGKLIIHLSWDNNSPDDVDLWVMTDNPDVIVGFRSKDQKNMVLDNDNLGMDSHMVEMSDGTVKNTFGNNENVMIKECTNTHVTANLHLYGVKLGTTLPIRAKVELVSPQPYRVIYSTDIILSAKGQEITAISFDLDEQCNVTNISEVFVPFIYTRNDGVLGPSSFGTQNQ